MKLWNLPLTRVIDEWDKWDNGGTDLAGIRALCQEDRFYLLVKVLRRIDMLHPWIYERCREVEKEPNGYLDLWAREHYKSTIITFGGIIQEILRDPDVTVGIFSHTAPIAKGFLRPIKIEFESNSILKAAFPDILYENPQRDAPVWSLDAGIVVRRKSNPKESTIEAHGLVDGQPTSKHFKLLVYDDVVTKESVATPEQSKKTTIAWELSDNLGSQGGRKWHIGTRYSFADTYEEMMKRGSVIPRVHAATDDGTIHGKPVLFSRAEWDRKIRDQGSATIACQMLQNPLAGQQSMFDVRDLQLYEVRPATLNVYLLIDPARSRKQDSDNSAYVVLGFDTAGNKYLLDGYNHRMDLQERWQRLRDLYIKWVREPGIQSVKVGYERYGAIADLDYFKEKMRIDKFNINIEELEWPREGGGSKIDRVQRLGPDFRSHKFFLPYATNPERLTSNQELMQKRGYGYRISKSIRRKDSEGNIYDLVQQFKEQVHYFPFGGLKDLVDATSRIYDMEALPPILYDQTSLEPEFT